MFDYFFNYCANNPILTALLILLLTIMLVLGVFIYVFNQNISTPSNPPLPPVEKQSEKQERTASEQKEKTKETIDEQHDTIIEEQIEKQGTEEKKAPPPPKQPTRKRTTTKKENSKKEKDMLLDELKDIDAEMDFYEEDETDKIAKYAGKWVICQIITNENTTSDGETFFFELRASNGERLLASEEYTTYSGALRGIQTHKTNILNNNFRITLTRKGEYLFKLYSGKNLLLCIGESYTSKVACENAIESVKRFAQSAVIDENIQDLIVKTPTEEELSLPLLTEQKGKWIIRHQKDLNGENVYFFELYSENDEKLLASEEYTTYIGAVNGIQTYKTNISQDNFRITLTKRGDYVYKLLNKNGQLLCLGEHYRTKQLCSYVVEAVKMYAKNSPVLTDSMIVK